MAGRAKVTVRLVYREVASNDLQLEMAPAAPSLFTTLQGGSDALALNEDGSVNGPSNRAKRGSIVALFATGAGQTDPASVTGTPAGFPLGRVQASVTVDGRLAEVFYAGSAPTLVRVEQVNVRIPAGSSGLVAVTMTVAGRSSRPGVVIWVE